MAKCLIKDCDRKSASRGLCSACHYAARKLVRDGGASWEELVQLGIAKEPSGVKGPGPFVRAFLDKTKSGDAPSPQ